MTLSLAGRLPPAYGTLAAMRNLALGFLAAGALVSCAAAEVRILALGDSLVQGYGLPEELGFVPQLQAWLDGSGAEDVTVVNGGVSGDTTAGGLARVEWSLTEDIDAVIVELGGNDMLRGLDPGMMRENLDGILAAITARGLPVMLCSIPAPPNYGDDYARAFAAMYDELAAAHDAVPCDFLAGMTDGRDLRDVIAMMQPDGIHPTADGVVAIVGRIGPQVLELAESARAGSP
jgi:acyl-CoA thioesterase-1